MSGNRKNCGFRGLLLSIVLSTATLQLTTEEARSADPPPDFPLRQMDLRLDDALFSGEGPGDGPASLLLLLRQTARGWLRAWGTARDFNHAVHSARLDDVELTEKAFRLRLVAMITRDARSQRSGHASFEVDLSRRDDGSYCGRYRGEFRGSRVEGSARATELPALRRPPSDFEPVGPDEHPRILLRASELPALKRKAATPFGRAAVAKLEGPIGLALRYRLEGERAHAEKAIPLVERMMSRGLVSDQFGHNVGARLEQTAIAYDLCHDVWPAEFKRRVESYLLWAGDGVLRARRDTHQAVNWHVASNWASPLYSGAAFAGLALRGRKGPPPPRPAATNSGATVRPAGGYAPGRGVTVMPFASDEMPPGWLYAGGFKTDRAEGDPLADLGGSASARPSLGATVEFGGEEFAFRSLSRGKDEGYWSHEKYDGGKTLIDITNAVDREYFSTTFFYAVIENDAPRWVRFETTLHTSAILHLSGTRLEVGDVVRIEPGLYPMLVEAYIDQINPWGRQLMRPRLVEVAGEEARRLVAARRAERERELALWRERVKEHESLGGLDLRARDLCERARHMMYLFCREAVGNGGAQAELAHYSGIAERPPSRYAAAHRRVFGYAVSPQPDIELLLPRKMMAHVYPETGEPRAQEINGTPEIHLELFAALLPVVPERWRAAMLWGWQRHAGFTGSEWSRLVAGNPALSLLHYPLDLRPSPPGDSLPLTWRADDFGLYTFRNDWTGGDDFVLQVWLKAHPIGGWNAPNAGTFRLLGLDHVWATGPTDRNRHRGEESVVQLPDAVGLAEGACGKPTHLETRPDGSGVVSVDLTDVYSRRVIGANGRGLRFYERYGRRRNAAAFEASGISGRRSIAVDYSGESGAPCLIAIVDRIRGGGEKVWTWQLDDGGKKGTSDVERTTCEGNRFTVTKPDGARLRGVLVTDQRAVAEVRMTSMQGRAGSSAGKKLDRPVHGVFARAAADGDGSFFVVATIQRGPAARLRIDGAGLDAVVTVGKRTVRFDGERIVFGEVTGSDGPTDE